MGAGQSRVVDNALLHQNTLIQEIHRVAQDLNDKYSVEFLDPNFCNRIALIYNDKLLSYRKQDLDNISYTLGIVHDVPATKQSICQAIVKHYTDRLNLVSGIQYSLSYVSDRIFALTTGPRCEGNPEIFEESKCTGKWLNYLVMPDSNLPENKIWFAHLSNMQEHYLASLKKLLAILQQLQNYDSDINDERLRQLGDESRSIIDAMHQNAYKMYKLILTTAEEVKVQQEQDSIRRQKSAAALAALRTSQGSLEEM